MKTLSLGDYLWVARPPDEPQYPVGSAAAAAQQGQWIVLDCIAERKTFSDLLSSIRDKRYIEQKMRLIDCGLPTCLYIVETSSTNSHHQNFAPTTMISAIVSTAIESGLHVLKTRGLDHTASTLRANHLKVAARFKSGRCGTKFMTLEMFQKRTVKKHVETVGDLFSHALRQIPMCGTPSAQALVNRFGTMARLMKYLEETDSRTAQKEISMLQKVGVLQRVGPKLAQTIWSLFAEYF